MPKTNVSLKLMYHKDRTRESVDELAADLRRDGADVQMEYQSLLGMKTANDVLGIVLEFTAEHAVDAVMGVAFVKLFSWVDRNAHRLPRMEIRVEFSRQFPDRRVVEFVTQGVWADSSTSAWLAVTSAAIQRVENATFNAVANLKVAIIDDVNVGIGAVVFVDGRATHALSDDLRALVAYSASKWRGIAMDVGAAWFGYALLNAADQAARRVGQWPK